MPALHAAVAHRAWVAATVRYLRGERDLPPATTAENSENNPWLQRVCADLHANAATQHTLLDVHAQLHARAAALIALRQAGHTEAAQAGIDDVYRLRDDLMGHLSRLF